MSTSNTIRLHHVLKAPADRIYRAFLDSDALAQWLPPYGFTCRVHSWDPVVGGKYQMSFTNFTTMNSHSWRGEFLELQPGKLLKYRDQFDDPDLPEKMVVTVQLNEMTLWSEVHLTQENIPAAIPLELCYLGWQESLKKLARLVEPDLKE